MQSDSENSLGIATLHQLRRLTLSGICINDKEVAAIREGCPHLELLDVSSCIVFPESQPWLDYDGGLGLMLEQLHDHIGDD